jgi:putative ABC transport system permease protein
MLTFAWQNLTTRWVRTFLAVVGLTIPIVAILGLFSLTNGIRSLMGNTLARMKGLMVMRVDAPAPVFSELPLRLAGKLRAVPGVRIVAPEVWRIAPPLEGRNVLARAAAGALLHPGGQGLAQFAETIMIDGEQLPEHLFLRGGAFKHSLLPPERGGGRYLAASDVGQPHVVISTKIARDYPNADGTPKKVGDTLRIGDRPFRVVGLYETGSLLIDVTVVMEISVARELFKIRPESVSAFYLEPAAGTDTDVLRERITSAVANVQVRSMAQFDMQVGNIMAQLNLFLVLVISLALLVGGVGIANTMLMSASERYREFGVMRANGWTRKNILGLVTAESALLGLVAGLTASTLAFAGVIALNMYLAHLELRLELTPGLVVASNAVALVVATAAGLYPAWRASRMTPMDAIRSATS